MRILLFSGKGGVGKSTMSCAAAAARRWSSFSDRSMCWVPGGRAGLQAASPDPVAVGNTDNRANTIHYLANSRRMKQEKICLLLRKKTEMIKESLKKHKSLLSVRILKQAG